jgi:hypothetical protein
MHIRTNAHAGKHYDRDTADREYREEFPDIIAGEFPDAACELIVY